LKIVPHKDADGNLVAGQYDINYFKLGDRTQGSTIISGVQLTVDQVKEIDENRVIWADNDGNAAAGVNLPFVLFKPSSGELNGYMSVQHDVDSYSAQLDKLAKAMAFAVNAVHSGKTDAVGDEMPFFVNSQNTSASSR
jgi:flagellar hook-associated protein 1 FlgK